jgi:hypothetical protein
MEDEPRKNPSLLAAVRTIVWSFLGIRRSAAHESETVHLRPVQIVIAGLMGAVIFVLVLIALVRFIVSSAN